MKDYPFKSHFLDRNGMRLHYLDEGREHRESASAGTPVLMVHGNPTWSYYYRHLVSALSDRHRVIVPDHLGCGLSDKPAAKDYPFTLAARVADLEALVDSLLPPEQPLKLVVHDWGGMIGLAWAVRNPQRVEQLVVLNTAAFHLPAGKPIPWQLRLVRNTPLGAALVKGLNLFARGALRDCVKGAPLGAEERAAYLKPYDSWAHRHAVLRFVEDIPLRPGDPSYDLVSEVASKLAGLQDVPMLIGWGLQDFVFDADYLAEWVRRFPEAELLRFEDAGHYVLEDKRAILCDKIRDFFDSPEQQSATENAGTQQHSGAREARGASA